MKLVTCLLLFMSSLSAQITSSTLSGNIQVNNEPGKNLKITLIHLPTNYVYDGVSNEKGFFSLDNLDVGGPYKLIIQIDDKKFFIRTYETLLLGENEIGTLKL